MGGGSQGIEAEVNRSRAHAGVGITYTARGETGLAELVTVIMAGCNGTPEAIARILDEVIHADLDDLAAALSAVGAAKQKRTHPGGPPQPRGPRR